MFSYSPYGTAYDTPNADYLRALADERAARAQYQAARRAQEDARARAARARLARQASIPYSSYLDDCDDSLSGFPYGYSGYNTARQRALEEQRRRALLERERVGLEEERRARVEEEQRRRLAEEQRLRQLLAEEQRQRDADLDPFLGTFGWRSPRADGDSAPRAVGRAPPRARTASPPQRRQPSTSSPAPTQPAYVHTRASSVPPKGPASPGPKVQSPVSEPKREPQPTPEEVAAAQTIQAAYRAHAGLRTVSALCARFDSLRNSFIVPPELDFMAPEGTVPVSTTTEEGHPALAYTSTNRPLHAYDEELTRVLSALDAVESHGNARVRAARRDLVRAVEREAERLEQWKGALWRAWVGQGGAGAREAPADVADCAVDTVATPQPPSDAVRAESAMRVEQAEQTEDRVAAEAVDGETAQKMDVDVDSPSAEPGASLRLGTSPSPSLHPDRDTVSESAPVPVPDTDVARARNTVDDTPLTPPLLGSEPPVIIVTPAPEAEVQGLASSVGAGIGAEAKTEPWTLVDRQWGDVEGLDML
ncbi:hypothetical protein B0H21DRAFT_748018 [Amylocystis lapponica]|nr:hypothetical protein B0H21DRAFT_748018 [Amylocystis lapponica]